jgi:hypothetical protein
MFYDTKFIPVTEIYQQIFSFQTNVFFLDDLVLIIWQIILLCILKVYTVLYVLYAKTYHALIIYHTVVNSVSEYDLHMIPNIT